MNKSDIIAKVKHLELPEGSYILYGACPLALAGIRESRDIDMLVNPEAYQTLKQRGWRQIFKSTNDHPLTFDVFEAHDNWNFDAYQPTLEDLLSRATIVDDIAFASLDDVRKWKKAAGRPKDLVDLKLIDDYEAKSTP